MTTETNAVHESALRRLAGASMMEAFGAIAAIALAIVGLAGVFSTTMAAIAAIVIGASILLEGGAFGANEVVGETRRASYGSFSSEFLGGLAGIVLGILALLGVAQQTLLSVSLIVFGAAILLTGLSRTDFATASGGQVFVGLGAVVLGILAVIGLAPLTLILVGMLSLGVGAFFSGSGLGARSMVALSH